MLPKPVPEVWRAEIAIPEQAIDAYEDILSRFTDTVSCFMADPVGQNVGHGGLWFLEAFSRSPFPRIDMEVALSVVSAVLKIAPPVLHITRVPNMDWVVETMRSFPPISVGRYFIHGSHFTQRLPASRIRLQVDAGTAFGSGEHATTKGCLEALDWLKRRCSFRNPLDLGCGSGILALAIAKTWPTSVLAADIDPESVRVTKYNASHNGESAKVKAIVSDGYRNPEIRRNAPYDLIVANILARPLAAMAPALAHHLAPGGIAVLSGLFDLQERWIVNAHRSQGLRLIRRVIADENWRALIMEKPASSVRSWS